MNAIVALCHFCEAHGPRAIFCTYSGSGTETAAAPAQPCGACGSLGADTVLVSRTEHGAYISRETLPSPELTALLRQAAIRSLTCEVSWSKEGGAVYFSEGGACHVLSFTFQLRDSRARGLRRWFACLALMRDQPQLLSVMPFFTEHMKKSATELQGLASAVFDEEQRVCSQRALRLNTGRNDFGPSRSLQQLTGEDNIFHKLHMTYAWMLQAGSQTHTETLHTSSNLLARLDPEALRGSVFSPGACDVEEAALRRVREVLGERAFRAALYCTLTGTEVSLAAEVLLISDSAERADIAKSLRSVLPGGGGRRVREARAGGAAGGGGCVLAEGSGGYECGWSGTLPAKCPTLMTRIEDAMSNSKFNDAILDQHIKCLQLEWLGTARTLKNAIKASGAASEPVLKLKQVLGVGPHDEQLLAYWLHAFCT